MKPESYFTPPEPEPGPPYCADPKCSYCAELRAKQEDAKRDELDSKSQKGNATAETF